MPKVVIVRPVMLWLQPRVTVKKLNNAPSNAPNNNEPTIAIKIHKKAFKF